MIKVFILTTVFSFLTFFIMPNTTNGITGTPVQPSYPQQVGRGGQGGGGGWVAYTPVSPVLTKKEQDIFNQITSYKSAGGPLNSGYYGIDAEKLAIFLAKNKCK